MLFLVSSPCPFVVWLRWGGVVRPLLARRISGSRIVAISPPLLGAYHFNRNMSRGAVWGTPVRGILTTKGRCGKPVRIDRVYTSMQDAVEELENIRYELERIFETAEIHEAGSKISRKISGAITSISKAYYYMAEATERYRFLDTPVQFTSDNEGDAKF